MPVGCPESIYNKGVPECLASRKPQGETPGQDGGISKCTVLPHTTKRRTITDLKTKNNQNSQKIELYGSPTTKELKKTCRRGGDGQLGREDLWQGEGWGTGTGGGQQSGCSHIFMPINREEQLGSETD